MTEDSTARGRTFLRTAIAHHLAGRLSDAIEWYRRAIPVLRADGDHQREGDALNNLGGAQQAQGHLDDAADSFLASLEVRRRIDDLMGQAKALNNIGVLRALQGDFAVAETNYLQSLAIRQRVDDKNGQAETMQNLALLHESLRDLPGALTIQRQANLLFLEAGNETARRIGQALVERWEQPVQSGEK